MPQVVKKLILLELNEINFKVLKCYLDQYPDRFPGFIKLFKCQNITTTSELNYDHLEPWIQWPSVHLCKTYDEHKIFRLGDIVHSNHEQIFEQIEREGFKVGVISAMNAVNRLQNASYFIPDPWTATNPDPSYWSRLLSSSINQAVNDNAQSKITLKTAAKLTMAFLKFARFSHYYKYIKFIFYSASSSWNRALVLDLLLHDIHWALFEKKNPDFSTLFLNAGAHIQHHYLFNSKPLLSAVGFKNPDWYLPSSADPLCDVLELYDFIINEYICRDDVELLVATGLSQKAYDSIKYYYRLNNHSEFLDSLNIQYDKVLPRMTRDFLVEFDSINSAAIAQVKLSSLVAGENRSVIFGQIDNRGKSLFVTLTYPCEITKSTKMYSDDMELLLYEHVSFVAIKNGMHQSEGYAFFTEGLANLVPSESSHISEVGCVIRKYFGLTSE